MLQQLFNIGNRTGAAAFRIGNRAGALDTALSNCYWDKLPEVESSRTHFEVLGLGLEGQVLGLGLEASSPLKLACPRLEDSTTF